MAWKYLMVWECLKTWSTDSLIAWNDLRMSEGLINQLSDKLKWPENILWSEVLKIWQSGFLSCWSSDGLMIWDCLKLSENVWKFLKVSDNVWRYSFLTDWPFGGLRITDNLMFWSSDVLKCLINSEKFWYQLFSDIQIIRESVILRQSDFCYWYQIFSEVQIFSDHQKICQDADAPIADFIDACIDTVSSTDSLGTSDCSAVAGEGEDVGAMGGDANRWRSSLCNELRRGRRYLNGSCQVFG